jgi:hypothetical protein
MPGLFCVAQGHDEDVMLKKRSLRSHDDDATIVLDRHNLIYAYGPLEQFEEALRSSDAHVGEPADLGTHLHHYHAVWDDMERRILRRFDWQISPLRPPDVQFDSGH